MKTRVSPLERLLIKDECTRLMTEYAWRFDHGQGVRVAELFTQDAAWRSPMIDAVGQDAVREFFARRDAMTARRTRHVVTNISIDVLDAGHARGRSYAVEIRDEVGADGWAEDTRPALVGDYYDDFVCIDGRWLFQERRVALDFKRPTEVLLKPVTAASE